MREIKFRAWDKSFKKMLVVDNLYFDLERGLKIQSTDEDGNVYTHEKDDLEIEGYSIMNIILMQYTGLKDKNGKEIYERDITKLTAISPIHHAEFKEIIEVKFENGSFYPFGMMVFNGFKEENYEVIGNIYENPELLKKQKPIHFR